MREPNPEEDQSALHMIGYHTSQKELRDVYHSVYLLNRAPGSPSCGEVRWKRAIWEILSSLQERLWRQTSSTNAEDSPENKMGLASLPMYEVALWYVCRKVMETAASLQNDLDRLDNEMRGRPWARTQSRTQCRCDPGVGIEDGPEAGVKHDLRVDTDLKLEVCTGNILGVDLGIEQEPGPGITIKLALETNEPVLKTIARNPKIGGSALGYLKARTWQQRTGTFPSNCPLRTENHGWINRLISWVIPLGGKN